MNVQLGIDFGTTHTVVAAVDRGNYPIVNFVSDDGECSDSYPSLVAYRDGEWRFGLAAQEVSHTESWTLYKSFKRHLADCTPGQEIQIGDARIAVIDLLQRFLAALKHDLLHRSNLELQADTCFEILLSVPANANNNQRFLTAEAFRLAGFEVSGVINEPTAAGVEYVNRYGVKSARSRKHYLLVYDLGGGTFDVAVIGIGAHQYETLATEGVMRLGGDDFDRVLRDLALATVDPRPVLSASQASILLDECREKKESLHPNTRKISIDLGRALPGMNDATVQVGDFFAACQPLVDETLEVVKRTLERTTQESGVGLSELSSLYIVGGASQFPLVNRSLREVFKRYANRSSYPHGAVAVGLAVALDKPAQHELKEHFTRDFGVWREHDSGAKIVFDSIFHKGTPLPAKGEAPLQVTRRYRPSHNIGHLRFIECGRLDANGRPSDNLSLLQEVHFPYDPRLQSESRLDDMRVVALQQRPVLPIEETYQCDAQGVIQVTIRDTATGYERLYLLADGQPRLPRPEVADVA